MNARERFVCFFVKESYWEKITKQIKPNQMITSTIYTEKNILKMLWQYEDKLKETGVFGQVAFS